MAFAVDPGHTVGGWENRDARDSYKASECAPEAISLRFLSRRRRAIRGRTGLRRTDRTPWALECLRLHAVFPSPSLRLGVSVLGTRNVITLHILRRNAIPKTDPKRPSRRLSRSQTTVLCAKHAIVPTPWTHVRNRVACSECKGGIVLRTSFPVTRTRFHCR